MTAEIITYIILSTFAAAIRRIISGIKNGAFYGKGNLDRYENPAFQKYIKKYIDNLHYAETPAWYTQAAQQYFLLMAIFRPMYAGEVFWKAWLVPIGISVLLVMAYSALSSVAYQGFINIGSGLPFIDPKENPKSEFAFWKWSFWWRRPLQGKGRVWVMVLGVLYLSAGLFAARIFKPKNKPDSHP